jgi:Xaa-Pro aminopeptidase
MQFDESMKRRHKIIKEKMFEQGIDSVLILNSTSLFYFTGFNPMFHDHPMYLTIRKDEDAWLVVNFVRRVHALQDSWVRNLITYGPSSPEYGEPVYRDPIEAVRRSLKGVKRLGIEEGSMHLSSYRELKSSLEKMEFCNIMPWIHGMRCVKDQYEIQCIRNAAEITNVGMRTALELAKSKADEMEICIEAEYAMAKEWRKRFPNMDTASPVGGPEGAILRSLWCLCPSGPRAKLITDTPTTRKLEDGDIALPRVWATCGGYVAENERGVIVGEPTDKQKRILKGLSEARDRELRSIRPGATCDEVFQEAREVKRMLEETEPDDDPVNRIPFADRAVGHGVGLEWHERPVFNGKDTTELQAGMVVTVEPKAYADGLQYGHSDTLLVTEEGYEFLTDPSDIGKDGIITV